jgi:hypothetical protein
MEAGYFVAAIDVHKRMLAVVVTDVKPGEMVFHPAALWDAANTVGGTGRMVA